jgi:hypothetical protein
MSGSTTPRWGLCLVRLPSVRGLFSVSIKRANTGIALCGDQELAPFP